MVKNCFFLVRLETLEEPPKVPTLYRLTRKSSDHDTQHKSALTLFEAAFSRAAVKSGAPARSGRIFNPVTAGQFSCAFNQVCVTRSSVLGFNPPAEPY